MTNAIATHSPRRSPWSESNRLKAGNVATSTPLQRHSVEQPLKIALAAMTAVPVTVVAVIGMPTGVLVAVWSRAAFEAKRP